MESLHLIEPSRPAVSPAAHICSLPVSATLETSLASLMGLETLRHGTTMDRAFSILSEGADPKRGGSGASKAAANGSSHSAEQALPTRCQGYFHVLKDRGFSCLGMKGSLMKSLTARFYAGYTAYGTAERFKCVAAAISFLFAPTIRFHYTTEEKERTFEDDPDSKDMALRTTKHLPNDRIGITSIFKYGSFKGFSARLKENPYKTIKAIGGVALGTLFTCTGLGLFF